MSLSPDGKQLAKIDEQLAEINLFELPDGKRLQTFELPPDGDSQATADTRDHTRPVEGASLMVALEFSPEGRFLVLSQSVNHGSRMVVWDLNSPNTEGQVVATTSDNIIARAHFHPDGEVLVFAHSERRIQGVRAESGSIEWELEVDVPLLSGVDSSPDGRLLAAIGGGESDDGTLLVWDRVQKRVVHRIPVPGRPSHVAPSFSSGWGPNRLRFAQGGTHVDRSGLTPVSANARSRWIA